MSLQVSKREAGLITAGFVAGYMLKCSSLMKLLGTYVALVYASRSAISLLLAHSNDDVCKALNRHYGINVFDSSNMHFEYNTFYNTIAIRRSLTSKVLTDKDTIINNLKQCFNMLLFFDIFYHVFPLKITFE
ncbi:MAG: hypothetical protein Terrestrivirus13_7 [Terrestrivirus sp.]|uniref:Uncharacterized protein n=1 Tax=Terrestrivirus sp. TaxID=2487775 RepID=A0A3G4ZRW4_9VIRU|nr:MAG: hypothetical protein Terrestrivirus13_7 [Terrestrivirus sp.]